jgi:hypothetical protein
MVATVAEAVGTQDREDAVAVAEVVEVVEITTRVSAPIAKLTAIIQMHAESGNTLKREGPAEETAEETTSTFATSAGSQATSKSIASPTNI